MLHLFCREISSLAPSSQTDLEAHQFFFQGNSLFFHVGEDGIALEKLAVAGLEELDFLAKIMIELLELFDRICELLFVLLPKSGNRDESMMNMGQER